MKTVCNLSLLQQMFRISRGNAHSCNLVGGYMRRYKRTYFFVYDLLTSSEKTTKRFSVSLSHTQIAVCYRECVIVTCIYSIKKL